MTSDDSANLMAYLATQFARMDAGFAEIHARFTGVDARFARIEDRLTAVEARLTRIEARQDAMEARLGAMEPRLDAMEARLDAMEVRLTRIAVLHEETRADVRRVAEGVVALSERVDREIQRIHVRFDRFDVDFGTIRIDHEVRITALEQHRRRRGPRG